MFGYYFHLALKSLRSTPAMAALMVAAMALGIGACNLTLTVYHVMSMDPIWWKSNALYAITMDSWDPSQPYDPHYPRLAPPLLTYRDAVFLQQSHIATRAVLLYELSGTLAGAQALRHPVAVATQATTSDFFSMFDVPFEYGRPWDVTADQTPTPVLVLSKRENDELFGGIDSVGRTVDWNGMQFRIVGVMDDWWPKPKFYDVVNGKFERPDDAFVPFKWGVELKQYPSGPMECWGAASHSTYERFLTSDCIWIEMWVELSTKAKRDEMQGFLDAYWVSQRRTGRFERPMNNHLTDLKRWLVINHVVPNSSKLFVWLALAFFAVCLTNTAGLQLAKVIRDARTARLRRALGASQRDILLQYLTEAGLLSLLAAALGLALADAGLKGLYSLYSNGQAYAEFLHFNPVALWWSLCLAIVSILAIGLFPARRTLRDLR